VFNMLLFVVGIPSIIAGIVAFLPRISVTPTDPLNPADPFSAPFVVSNDGYIPLTDVQFACRPEKVNFGSRLTLTFGSETVIITPAVFNVGTLDLDSKTTVPCALDEVMQVPHPIAGPVTEAQITILISYRPLWLWRKVMESRFVLTQDNAGSFSLAPARTLKTRVNSMH
jgi:hypothetical protein